MHRTWKPALWTTELPKESSPKLATDNGNRNILSEIQIYQDDFLYLYQFSPIGQSGKISFLDTRGKEIFELTDEFITGPSVKIIAKVLVVFGI